MFFTTRELASIIVLAFILMLGDRDETKKASRFFFCFLVRQGLEASSEVLLCFLGKQWFNDSFRRATCVCLCVVVVVVVKQHNFLGSVWWLVVTKHKASSIESKLSIRYPWCINVMYWSPANGSHLHTGCAGPMDLVPRWVSLPVVFSNAQ